MTEHEKYLERNRKAKVIMSERGVTFAEAVKILENGPDAETDESKKPAKKPGLLSKLFGKKEEGPEEDSEQDVKE